MSIKEFIKKIYYRTINAIVNIHIKEKKNRVEVQNIKPYVEYFIPKGATILTGTEPFTHRKNLVINIKSGGTVFIGSRTFFNDNVMINCHKKVIIGNDCFFGPNICIFDHDHAIIDEKIQRDKFVSKSISIGNNVWIGAGTVILKGSVIEDGAIIGAGSVITGYISENKVVIQKRMNTIIERKDTI